MLRALWFLIRLSALAAAVVWLSGRPGTVEVDWLGYEIDTSIGFVIACLLVLFVLWGYIIRLWRSAVSVPAVFRRYTVSNMREKGYRAVTAGLVAIAAGDGRAAEKYARRAEDMIPGTPLTKLLEAQTAMMNGNAPKARRLFRDLLDDDEAAFFGIRGLLNDTLRERNYGEALTLVRRAAELQPKRAWVIRTLFDLETRERDWAKAAKTLTRAEKLGVFSRARGLKNRQALLTAQAEDFLLQNTPKPAIAALEHAFSIDPGFTPAAARLARLYINGGKIRAATKTLEKSWEAGPHPDIALLWTALTPKTRKKSSSLYDGGRESYAWVQKLTALKPDHRESHRAAGLAALDGRLWREARTHLLQAGDYRALAKLEQAENGFDAKKQNWLQSAIDAPLDPKWVCTACGHAENEWTPNCPRCGIFNHQDWMTPDPEVFTAPVKAVTGFEGDLISPPFSEV